MGVPCCATNDPNTASYQTPCKDIKSAKSIKEEEQQSSHPEGDYVGEKLNGKPHGQGIFTWPAGHYYEGKWQHGKRHGQGKYQSANGYCYEGVFANDSPYGIGRATYPSGEFY